MSAASVARLLFLAVIWGGSYSFMRIAAPVLGGIATMWLRISLAGVVLLAYALVTQQDMKMRQWWRQYLFIGLLNSALPFALISYAMKTLPAGYGAILNAASPFFAALFAAIMLHERFTPSRLVGMLLGMVGVIIVINLGPIALTAESAISSLAMIAATCSYGFIIVYTRKYTLATPNIGMAVGSLLLPAILLAPIGIAALPDTMPSTSVIAALVTLAILCSSIAYLLYFRLIRDVGPTRTISITFLMPVFGAVWGALLFGEKLNSGAILGGAVVLVGVMLVLDLRPGRKLKRI